METIVFRYRPFSPIFPNAGTADKTLWAIYQYCNYLGNKIPSNTKYQSILMKIQAHSSSEPPPESEPDSLEESRVVWTSYHLRHYRKFKLVLKWKERKFQKIFLALSRNHFSESVSVNTLTYSDEDDKTSGPLSRVAVADAFFRKHYMKSQESQFSGRW